MAESLGGAAPGSLTLLELIEEHRGEFEYDWRTRFGVALADIPEVMDWGEAWRLFRQLLRDPASHVYAAVAGWGYPLSREALAQADLFDAFVQVNSKRKPKPYPRPWTDPSKKRMGRATRPQREIRAALAARGHH